MLTEEDLVLYYYGEGTNEDRTRIASALSDDSTLAARYRALCTDLDAVTEADVPAGSERHAAWHRVVDDLDLAERDAERKLRSGLHAPSFVWGLAASAVVALGVLLVLGRQAPVPAGPPSTIVADAATDTRQRIPTAFSRGLQQHFRDSQAAINEFDVGATDARADLIGRLVEQNRMFERAAAWHDFDDMARLLRAFERVLVQLDSGQLTPTEAEMLKSQLAFEFNVVLTKLAAQPSTQTESI